MMPATISQLSRSSCDLDALGFGPVLTLQNFADEKETMVR
jgi:hypothetical protein